VKKVKNKALPSWVLLQKAVTSLMGSYSGVTLLEASKHTLPELTTYLPNAMYVVDTPCDHVKYLRFSCGISVSDTRHYRSLGRLLAICLWMAFPVSFGFPSCLYRMLIARSGAGNPAALKLHDLDQFDPMTALQLRLKLADVVYSPAKLEPLHQAVHNAIRASLVTGRQPQFSAMSVRFLLFLFSFFGNSRACLLNSIVTAGRLCRNVWQATRAAGRARRVVHI